MPAPSTQVLTVPDVGAGPGPWPSLTWTAATLSNLLRLGLAVGTNEADLVVLLGSATGTDPITPSPPTSNTNHLATFVGGAGSQAADLLNVQACAYYALLRYAPPAGTSGPTTGATLEMTGT